MSSTSRSESAILLNIAYGNGPYLRMTECALRMNDLWEQRGEQRRRVIVPLLYGNRQRRIMEEELEHQWKQHLQELLLDEELGALLSPLLYARETYAETLRRWLAEVDRTEERVRAYLRRTYGSAIVCELLRAPRLRSGITAPSYLVSFALTTEILERARGIPDIAIDDALLQNTAERMRRIEEGHFLYLLSVPGTWTGNVDRKPFFPRECLIPPTIQPQTPWREKLDEGIYVTVTGIPGLEKLYRDARRLGLRIYASDSDTVPGSTRLPPTALGNPAIRLHIARAGWSSIWLSLLTETPFVATPWDASDDPEIYFNNRCVERLGIGTVGDGQPLDILLKKCDEQRQNMAELRASLLRRFGTIDGITVAAQRIVDDMAAKNI